MTQSPVSYLQSVETYIQIALPPAEINQPLLAVKSQLNKLLFKFNDKLAGVPLCYGEFRFLEGKKYGRFYADHPWVHIDIICDLVIFRPSVGDRIIGKISKTSENNVAILILSLFNASISGEEMRKNYKFNPSSNSWESVKKNESLREGDEIEFSVSSYQYSSGVINILGSL